MQTKQFFKTSFVLGTNTVDYNVHIYGVWLNIGGWQGLPEILIMEENCRNRSVKICSDSQECLRCTYKASKYNQSHIPSPAGQWPVFFRQLFNQCIREVQNEKRQ